MQRSWAASRAWHIQFRDPVADPDHAPTLFEWAGGLPALTAMTRIFYSKYVPGDPLIGPLFAEMATDHAERVASWLGEVFGGPRVYSERYGGYPRMLSQHGKDIVQLGTRADGTQTRWSFTEITADSFHWTGEALHSDGRTWRLEGEFQAKRRTTG